MPDGLCESCAANPATFHVTRIHNGQKQENHLCEACATAQGLMGEGAPAVAGLMETLTRGSRSDTSRCPHCGITYDEFRAKGRFGCPRDYEVFEDALVELVGKMHNAARRHTGRMPAGFGPHTRASDETLLGLRRELRQAVDTEDYERAARLRDAIREQEESPSGGGSGEA